MVVRINILLLVVFFSVSPCFAAKNLSHKVKKNENIVSIAKKYHLSVKSLREANEGIGASVKPGDILAIPSQATGTHGGSGAANVVSSYKVKKGDTITKISKKTGISIAMIKRLNGLGKGKLKVGQVLALHEVDGDVDKNAKIPSRPSLRYADLLNEKEYEQSLAELTEQDDASLRQQVAPDFNADNVKLLKAKAFGFLGTRYRFGGTSRSGLDCSAFVQKVFNEMDVPLPRTAREQFEKGEVVNRGDMQKGDLVFFRTYAPFPSHVGIYLGGNRMIHASSRDRRVVISSFDTPYYRSRFIGAKRVAKISPDHFNLDELMSGIEEESPDEATHNDMLNVDGVEVVN